MSKSKLAWLWAAAILSVSLAEASGLVGDRVADGLFFGLVMGAVGSLSRARCESC